MKKLLLFISIVLLGFTNVYATHNRAGEITYTYIGDANHPYKYHITITTYTNTCNTQADRCELTIYFGDGDSAIAPRTNGPSNQCASPEADGVQLSTACDNGCTKLNIYQIDHEYPGNGTYDITMDDPNRNAGTCNIQNGNSVNVSFSLVSELVINPFLGSNNSPILLNYPLDCACVGQCFYHNPGAYDVDDDSLAFSIVPCNAGGQPIPGWVLPPNMHYSDMNPYKGDLVWCAPDQPCQYSIAILIKEYRRLPGFPQRYYIGYILRDMQITVATCNNTPPQIPPLNDTCVVAGSNLHFTVSATDSQVYPITLEANGGPFHITPDAVFTSTQSSSPVHGTFNWTPSCSEVQLLPYLVTFKATDSNPINPLAEYQSMFIRVIAPAPTGLTATPSGASIILNWNAALCHATLGNNPLSGYYIYRKNSCDSVTHSLCETGLPGGSGYTLIGTTNNATTTFTDNNGGSGLVSGINYSYVVVAFYSDGSQSYVSANVCATLVRDVPIITNVSVLSTGTSNGSMWIHWVKPLTTVPNLDTIANPPPYEYRLMQAQGNPPSSSFTQVSSYTYNNYSQVTDTGFVSTNLNTQGFPYTYRVDFYSNNIFKGSTNTASSVFLTSTPTGNQVNLFWQQNVSWVNYRYDIYKETTLSSGIFNFLISTTNQSYVDTGLFNGTTYCYKVVSIGQFTDPAIPRPLWNTSEIKCETPVDTVPPCQPHFSVENDCGIFQNVLSWTNPNNYCCHDAIRYNVYFASTTDAPLQLIYTTTDMSNTQFTHQYTTSDGIQSVAGCYAVTAVDTAGNESRLSTKICVDNCPEYELPNVFTPNGDGINDLVTPLPGYRYVKDVDMKIYDRWGLLMFQTTDKDILWDGKNSATKMMCTDGVYFYLCTVNEIHVDGIKPRALKGFIQLFHEKTSTPH